MPDSRPRSCPQRMHLPAGQSGLVLVTILVVLAAGAITALLAFASPPITVDARDMLTEKSLAQARVALIGRAAADAARPGSLPCPDVYNEDGDPEPDGDADTFFGEECPSYIGRLPWRTLGLPDLRDASGERLWYALPPALRDFHASAPAMNSTTLSPADLLRLVGAASVNDIAAVVIAPGAVLAGQSRISANENDPAHYLEGENANGDDSYENQVVSTAFNDRVAIITRQQLFDVVELRVANEIRTILERYYVSNDYYPYANDTSATDFLCTDGLLSGRIPDPDATTPCSAHVNWTSGVGRNPPAWFVLNGWHPLTYYALAPECTITTAGCTVGSLSVNGINGKRAVVIVGGRALASQTPSCVGSLCIEQPLASANQYQRSPVSGVFNDRVAVAP